MDKIKVIWSAPVLLVLVFLFSNVASLQMKKIDLFNEHAQSEDGLYLLIVPFVFIPVVFIFSIIKWAILRNSHLPRYIRLSHILYIVAILLSFFLTILE